MPLDSPRSRGAPEVHVRVTRGGRNEWTLWPARSISVATKASSFRMSHCPKSDLRPLRASRRRRRRTHPELGRPPGLSRLILSSSPTCSSISPILGSRWSKSGRSLPTTDSSMSRSRWTSLRPIRSHNSLRYRRYLQLLSRHRGLFIPMDFVTGVWRQYRHAIPRLGIVKQSEHINYFSPDALRDLLVRTGFSVVAERTDPRAQVGGLRIGRYGAAARPARA